jgi:type IX secretion system PorP/SprF family membrane protein
MKTKLFFITVFAILGLSVHAQDANFSQNFSNPLSLNPAYAGSLGCSRFVADYSNTFSSIPGNDIIYCASYDQYVDRLHGGLGLIFTSVNEGSGTIIKNDINGTYSFNININDNFRIRPAINIGYGHNKLDWNDLFFGNGTTTNTTIPNNKLNVNYFNAGAGVLFAYKNFISGIALDHINQPNIGFLSYSELFAKLTIHSSLEIKITDNTNLTPGIIFQQQHDYGYSFLPSLMLNYRYIKFGVAFRLPNEANPDSFIGMLGFVNNRMSIGYSYDITISKLSSASSGVNEITAVFKFNCKNKEKYGVTHICGF